MLSRVSQWRGFVVPAGLLAAVLAIFLQVPPAMLDFLLAANLALATVILVTTFFVKTPLEFSVFPTVLLAATLGRLSLNIASTRLILLGGDSLGSNAGGQIIRSFGEFVAGDQLVVGVMIFLILVAVQFLVITTGAGRISEVAARFALDGMPGRQMAVDSDINAGLITEAEASERRAEITAQADFYGAMDGASKFVRGDAIAGLIIMGVNLCGGLIVGVGAGMSVTDATDIYSKLTVGDGLVSQIPALLISLAAGVLVSRSARRTELSAEVIKQLTARPEALAVSAVFLVALTMANLPVAPMLGLGALCAVIAVASSRATKNETDSGDVSDGAPQGPRSGQPTPRSTTAPTATAPTVAAPTQAELLEVDPLMLELGINLLKLVNPADQDNLLAHISYLRESLAKEMGFVLPKVRVRDNPRLERNAYRITMSDALIAHGELRPAMKLATLGESGEQLDDVVGEETLDPVTHQEAWWIPPSTEDEMRRQGCRIRSALDVLMDHFQRVILAHAAELLSRDAVKQLLEQLHETSPAATEEWSNGTLRLGDVQQTLQQLLRAGVSIRPLARILEALTDAVASDMSSEARVRFVRRRLGRLLVAPWCDDRGQLHAIVLEPQTEQQIIDRTLDLAWAAKLRGRMNSATRAPLVIVCSDEAYAPVCRWVDSQAPLSPVLAVGEIPVGTAVRAVAMTHEESDPQVKLFEGAA